MRSRAGKSTRRRARSRLGELPSKVWITLGAVVAVSVAAIVAVVAAVGRFDFWGGLVVGVAATALVSSIGWIALELAGARSFAIGGLAERWTADELGRLRRAG